MNIRLIVHWRRIKIQRSGEIRGKTFHISNYSSKGIHPDTLQNLLHPLVKEFYKIQSKLQTVNMRCAEPRNISDLLYILEKELGFSENAIKLEEAKKWLTGFQSKAKSIVNIDSDKLVHGLNKSACKSCDPLLKYFNITEIK